MDNPILLSVIKVSLSHEVITFINLSILLVLWAALMRSTDGWFRKKPKAGEVWEFKNFYYLVRNRDGNRIIYHDITSVVEKRKTKAIYSFNVGVDIRIDSWSYFQLKSIKYADTFEEFVEKRLVELETQSANN